MFIVGWGGLILMIYVFGVPPLVWARWGFFVLGILGIFIPFLWLIGAILPAREGSTYQMQEAARYQAQMG